MTGDPVPFLTSIAQVLSAMALYPEGHTSRERAIETVYERLVDLLPDQGELRFSFLGDEVVFGDRPVRELRDWEWSQKLADIGIQRLHVDPTVTREDLVEFLTLVLSRVSLQAVDTALMRPNRPTGIRFGLLEVRDADAKGSGKGIRTATISYNASDEADAIRWMHTELLDGNELPLLEAEGVVRALAVAMHGDEQMMLPLMRLRHFDEYTTTHSLNVSVLAMALAEWIGLGSRDVRAFGVAGLMHDIGKVKVPKEILTKSGTLTADERAVLNRHPADGARIILASEPDLDLSAVVAYEHHIMLDGGGYPSLHYDRSCHYGSKLVHVCDVYDALRTDRPYRDAWPRDRILEHIESRIGVEFDPELAGAFTHMMREWEEAEAVEENGSNGTGGSPVAQGPGVDTP